MSNKINGGRSLECHVTASQFCMQFWEATLPVSVAASVNLPESKKWAVQSLGLCEAISVFPLKPLLLTWLNTPQNLLSGPLPRPPDFLGTTDLLSALLWDGQQHSLDRRPFSFISLTLHSDFAMFLFSVHLS